MGNMSLSLVCARCSHDWVQEIGPQEPFRLMDKGAKQVKIYRISCPICGGQLMVEIDDGSSSQGSTGGGQPG